MFTVTSVGRNRHHAVRVVAAALAIAITVAMFTAVIGLFRVLGLPLKELADAERICAERTYLSEREACMRHWKAARDVRVAHR